MPANQHHFEVIVLVEDGEVIGVEVNGENSATWWDGTVYTADGDWVEPYDSDDASRLDEDDKRALDTLTALLAQFPAPASRP
jgi:hypothetical protein